MGFVDNKNNAEYRDAHYILHYFVLLPHNISKRIIHWIHLTAAVTGYMTDEHFFFWINEQPANYDASLKVKLPNSRRPLSS